MKKEGAGPPVPCWECEYQRPDLFQANLTIWELWSLIRTQWRTAGFGPIGLDFNAVISIAEIHGIELTPGLMKKIRLLEDLTIASARKERPKGLLKGGEQLG